MGVLCPLVDSGEPVAGNAVVLSGHQPASALHIAGPTRLAACPAPPLQAGRRPANSVIGRYLAETVSAVPHFSAEEFEKMLGDQQNDCTLVLFLSKLIQAHLALADKLGTMQLPLI